MARLRVSVERAAALHRQAAAVADGAAAALDRFAPEAAPAAEYAEQHELSARLRSAAAELVPGWLGAALDAYPAGAALPAPGTTHEIPGFVRLGTAQPLDDARFPVVVPLLGTGHLAVDSDARDPRTQGLLRSVVLRLLAGTPAGALRVRAVDATGEVFGAFRVLAETWIMEPAVSDVDGLRAVLAEAEQWLRAANRDTARRAERMLLIVVAALPELTEGADLARLSALAGTGAAAGLHLVVAGWPPPPLTAETTQAPLPYATQVELRNPHAVVGDPPGGSFGAGAVLNCPVYLDAAPPESTVHAVGTELVAQLAARGPRLAELVPHPLWAEDSADGLVVPVGRAGDNQLSLRCNDLTPHWLIGGAPGSGRTTLLLAVVYGLASRYGPDELTLYLLDFTGGGAFARFTPSIRDESWLPQARAVGVEAEREYGIAVLRELDALAGQRAQAYQRAGVNRFAQLRALRPAPRVVVVVDGADALLRGTDRTAREAVTLLETLARTGRPYGIHLILASHGLRDVESLYGRRESLLGQFPVRIALPGGADVLDPGNHSAGPLRLGQAVVNTAGGLGGPSGASRAHERLVEFPDPQADPELATALRHRMWQARPGGAAAPSVFLASATQHLPHGVPVAEYPTAYLGRAIDVPLSLAGFGFTAEPGRHLAVLGPSEVGADLLDAATRSLAAAHRPGEVAFAVTASTPAAGATASTLIESLTRAGHRVRVLDPAGFRALAADPDLRVTYLVGFGLDAGAAGGGGLGSVLRDGPARGVHLLGWWRGLRGFGEDTGERAAWRGEPGAGTAGDRSRPAVAGLVLLNVPAADAAMLLGDATLDWRPRPNRALLHDRHTGRTDLIVPFVHSGASG